MKAPGWDHTARFGFGGEGRRRATKGIYSKTAADSDLSVRKPGSLLSATLGGGRRSHHASPARHGIITQRLDCLFGRISISPPFGAKSREKPQPRRSHSVTTTFAQLGLLKNNHRSSRPPRHLRHIPIQAAAIPDTLSGDDICGKAPPGRARPLPLGCPCSLGCARGARAAPPASFWHHPGTRRT